MIIVSDTSPISNLLLINQLELLKNIYGKIIIPKAVMNELMALERKKINISNITGADWIEIISVTEISEVKKFLNEIDLGEAEAIVLAKNLHADWILMDETIGRNIAVQAGLKVIGIVGILLIAKERELISNVKSLIDEMISKANFRVSDKFYSRILELANEK